MSNGRFLKIFMTKCTIYDISLINPLRRVSTKKPPNLYVHDFYLVYKDIYIYSTCTSVFKKVHFLVNYLYEFSKRTVKKVLKYSQMTPIPKRLKLVWQSWHVYLCKNKGYKLQHQANK